MSEQDVDDERNFQVITGANMSGKSTYIRQVMLLQIMSQVSWVLFILWNLNDLFGVVGHQSSSSAAAAAAVSAMG